MRAYKQDAKAEVKLSEGTGLEFFIPKHYSIRIYHGRKIRKLIPSIPGLLFVHASHSQIIEFKQKCNFLQFAMWPKSSGLEYIIIPEKQMNDFINIVTNSNKKITYYKPEEIDIKKETRVKVIGGQFDGIEGYFVKVKGKRKKQVVILMDKILAVSIETSPDFIQVLP